MRFFKNVMCVVSAMTALGITVSCEKDPQGGPDTGLSENTRLVLSDTVVNALYDGGDYTVSYVLEEPAEGFEVQAVSEKDFVEVTAVSDTEITLRVAENTDTLARVSLVEVTYGSLHEYVEVRQEAAPVPDYKLTIEFNDVNEANPTLYVEVVGADPSVPYMVNALSIINMEVDLGFQNLDDPEEEILAWWQGIIDDNIKRYMESYNMSREDAIKTVCAGSTGNSERKFIALRAGIDHVAFVSQVDHATGQFTGGLTMLEFTNGMPPMEDVEYTIEVTDVTSTSAVCSVESTSPDDGFVAGVDLASKWEGMEDDEIVKKLCLNYFDWHQWSIFVGSGVMNITGLTPGEDYVVYAFSSSNAVPTSALYKYAFTTKSE